MLQGQDAGHVLPHCLDTVTLGGVVTGGNKVYALLPRHMHGGL